MSFNPFIRTRENAEQSSGEANATNKAWWESSAMTYEEWSADERDPSNKQHFENVNQAYLTHNPFLQCYFKHLDLTGKSVLEIGCGMGSAVIELKKTNAEKVVAIDLTEKGVKLSIINLEHSGYEADIMQMDAEDMSFSDDSFDFIFSWGVIHHSENPERILAHISRILVPGGKGVIMVYNRNSLRYFMKGLYLLIVKGLLFKGESFESVQKNFTDGYFHQHYTPREFQDILKSVGLTPEKTTLSHMAKQYVPFMPASIDSFLKSWFGWLLVVEFSKSQETH